MHAKRRALAVHPPSSSQFKSSLWNTFHTNQKFIPVKKKEAPSHEEDEN
jgi:hypothetical protein